MENYAHMKSSTEGADDFGERYFSESLSDSMHSRIQEEHELIMHLLSPRSGQRILDVGCGKGRIEQFFGKKASGIEVVSSDVTLEAKKYVGGGSSNAR